MDRAVWRFSSSGDKVPELYGAKYDKAAERMVKDRERLLISYDFPAGRSSGDTILNYRNGEPLFHEYGIGTEKEDG